MSVTACPNFRRSRLAIRLRLAWMAGVCCALLIPALAARADTLWIKAGAEQALTLNGVTIVDIRSDQIVFQTPSGHEATRPLAQVHKLAVDGEADLSAAEESLVEGSDWDKAVDGYQRTLRGTSKEWLKDWCAVRLLVAGAKGGRFDGVVSAYVRMLLKDPASAKAPPILPDAKSDYLNLAAAEVSTTLDQPKLTGEQRRSLLTFLVDLHLARNDLDAAGKASERLLQLSPGGNGDPGVVGAVTRLKLSLAQSALKQQQYQAVLDQIDQNRALFTEPAMQAEALWLLAEAQAGLLAGPGPETPGSPVKSDPGALRQVALAYMRVAAHFADLPGKPHVAQSLLRVAAIHEKLNEPGTALRLYEQVAAEFRDQPAGAEARDQVQRLRGAAGKAR